MSESSEKYRRAVSGLTAVVEGVPTDRWSAPSPCEGWTAAHVVGHVVAGFHRVAAAAGPSEAPEQTEAAPADPAAAYAAARDRALAVLTEENLAKTVQSPAGEMPLDQMVGMFSTPDVLIHSWDLAKAAGINVTLDPDLVRETYGALLPIDAMVRAAGVFGPKVEPPEGADPQTTLICFTGRQP
jgi:uncharacterized protein (TIGR03086 family)